MSGFGEQPPVPEIDKQDDDANLICAIPFFGCFSGCSWNAQAFFCHDEAKYRDKRFQMNNLLAERDLLGIQEAHSTDGREQAFKTGYGHIYA